eukprot:TRINITY_DN3774_c0_g1_i1.p1 TRINITY_DN3774_c0_g1~~TRINITY_DN3774_c0_g1_i1.p1  ORF type:complete len:616 (+),score=159.09 TRINITY_DN3774_c0_g1_i1:47-1849(+)
MFCVIRTQCTNPVYSDYYTRYRFQFRGKKDKHSKDHQKPVQPKSSFSANEMDFLLNDMNFNFKDFKTILSEKVPKEKMVDSHKLSVHAAPIHGNKSQPGELTHDEQYHQHHPGKHAGKKKERRNPSKNKMFCVIRTQCTNPVYSDYYTRYRFQFRGKKDKHSKDHQKPVQPKSSFSANEMDFLLNDMNFNFKDFKTILSEKVPKEKMVDSHKLSVHAAPIHGNKSQPGELTHDEQYHQHHPGKHAGKKKEKIVALGVDRKLASILNLKPSRTFVKLDDMKEGTKSSSEIAKESVEREMIDSEYNHFGGDEFEEEEGDYDDDITGLPTHGYTKDGFYAMLEESGNFYLEEEKKEMWENYERMLSISDPISRKERKYIEKKFEEAQELQTKILTNLVKIIGELPLKTAEDIFMKRKMADFKVPLTHNQYVGFIIQFSNMQKPAPNLVYLVVEDAIRCDAMSPIISEEYMDTLERRDAIDEALDFYESLGDLGDEGFVGTRLRKLLERVGKAEHYDRAIKLNPLFFDYQYTEILEMIKYSIFRVNPKTPDNIAAHIKQTRTFMEIIEDESKLSHMVELILRLESERIEDLNFTKFLLNFQSNR